MAKDLRDLRVQEGYNLDWIIENYTPVQNVIGFSITALSLDEHVSLMLKWAKEHLSKTVCVANTHMLVEARKDPKLFSVLEKADLVTPDGMPLVWIMRLLGSPHQERVAGLDILLALCKKASQEQVSIFFLGSQSEILERMKERLEREFPNLKVAGMEPLPFRPLTPEEDAEVIQKINSSGAGITLVALGCPKQELWMAAHYNKIQTVMVGLGGAFPVYAGIHKRAPNFIRTSGLEWLYRLGQEPRRLWGRYRSTIPPFLWLALQQVMTTPKLEGGITQSADITK